VTASSRSTNGVQGDIQNASVGTYMAINGDGYFVVEKPSSFADGRPVFDGIDPTLAAAISRPTRTATSSTGPDTT
jgi:hypothetical protein